MAKVPPASWRRLQSEEQAAGGSYRLDSFNEKDVSYISRGPDEQGCAFLMGLSNSIIPPPLLDLRPIIRLGFVAKPSPKLRLSLTFRLVLTLDLNLK